MLDLCIMMWHLQVDQAPAMSDLLRALGVTCPSITAIVRHLVRFYTQQQQQGQLASITAAQHAQHLRYIADRRHLLQGDADKAMLRDMPILTAAQHSMQGTSSAHSSRGSSEVDAVGCVGSANLVPACKAYLQPSGCDKILVEGLVAAGMRFVHPQVRFWSDSMHCLM